MFSYSKDSEALLFGRVSSKQNESLLVKEVKDTSIDVHPDWKVEGSC